MDIKEKKEFDYMEYTNGYAKKNYDRILILVPKGWKKKLFNKAKEKKMSLSKYVLKNKLFFESKNRNKVQPETSENFNAYKYINSYQKNNYDRITILVQKGCKEKLIEKAKKAGISLSKYILENEIE